MLPAEFDDAPFDPFASVLALAHQASVTQNEITALDFRATGCHADMRALLSI
jgi:hypothetical protein